MGLMPAFSIPVTLKAKAKARQVAFKTKAKA